MSFGVRARVSLLCIAASMIVAGEASASVTDFTLDVFGATALGGKLLSDQEALITFSVDSSSWKTFTTPDQAIVSTDFIGGRVVTNGETLSFVVPSDNYIAFGYGATDGWGVIGETPAATTTWFPPSEGAAYSPQLVGYEGLTNLAPLGPFAGANLELNLVDGTPLDVQGSSATFGASVRNSGFSPVDPLLPSSATGGAFDFSSPTSGAWFDPPTAHGFTYALSSGDFTTVGAPPLAFGFSPVEVVVAGAVVDVLNPGDDYNFAPGVTRFTLEGITPAVDPADPSAFPTYLAFSGAPRDLTMTPLSSAPEPDGWVLALLGTGALGGALRRAQRRGARPATA